MNYSAIEKDIRRFIQREFYLENNSEDKNKRMQIAAAKYAHENYPALTKCLLTVDYFGEIKLELA